MALLSGLSDSGCVHCKDSPLLLGHHFQHGALGGVKFLTFHHLGVGWTFRVKFAGTEVGNVYVNYLNILLYYNIFVLFPYSTDLHI